MDTKTGWKWRWKHLTIKTELPGVWQIQEGGFIVRARLRDPTTNAKREIRKVLPHATKLEAYQWLLEERARIKAGGSSAPTHSTHFGNYANSLYERKMATGELKSARSRERWGITVGHLIGGTGSVPGFGEMVMGHIRTLHIEQWKVGIAGLIKEGLYSPVTANGWLSILKTITKTAKRELGLTLDPAEGVRYFDTSEHPTYTEEEPNSLPPERVGEFLAQMRESYPEHYAMTVLGFALGTRPSHMRPLRRSGERPDVRWMQGEILVRRSHTLGDEVMETTKTTVRQRIGIPKVVIDVLLWHVETQLRTPEQKASELLFPARDGGFLDEHALRKPFERVGALIGLTMRFTPRGMRRTFNDLARASDVEKLVTMSISGHLTDKMREHYSTVGAGEQRESIARMLGKAGLVAATEAPSGTPSGAPDLPSGAPDRSRLH